MFGLIVAGVIGFLTPQFQSAVAPPVAKTLSFLKIEEQEYDLLGLLLAVLTAGLVATIIGSGTALTVAVGLTIGYFATRLIALAKEMTKSKNKSEPAEE